MAVQLADYIWRDYETDGVSASGVHKPILRELRTWGANVERMMLGAAAGATIYDSKADMVADTSQAANAMAWVLGDPVAANNGIYQFNGTTWIRLGDLPYSYILASNSGAGTANAIIATTSIPVPAAVGAALIALPIVADTDASPVTVAFNDQSPLTIKTSSGNNPAAGGLTAGMIVAGYVSGASFRLLTDQTGAAIQAAAEHAQEAAEAAAASVGYLVVADRTALMAVDPAIHPVVNLNETGREGVFKWNASDLSTEVSADVRQGLYVAPASDTTGAAGAWVRQGGWALTGAVIDWFYAAADASDYSAAIEAAAAVTGLLAAGAGDYEIVAGVSWPAKNITLRGAGFLSTRFHGGASALFAWSTAVTDETGNTVTQSVFDATVEQTGDGIGLKIHQTWTAPGKIGPKVSRCRLINSSATTTAAKCISLQGIWQADITDNWFTGQGSAGGPDDGIGGYGVYLDLGADLNTSVMNVRIQDNNKFLKIAYPVYVPPRVGDGRVEGLSVLGNWMVAGYIGIRTEMTLGSIVNSNLVSDFNLGIQANGDFDFTITGNPLVDGKVASIHLRAVSGGILERGTVSGNTVKARGTTVGILIENEQGNGAIRVLTIGSNTIGGVISGTATAIGIQFAGAYTVTNVGIASNAFEFLDKGIDYAGVTNVDIRTANNTFAGVTTKINNPSRSGTLIDKQFVASVVKALTGGASTEVISIDLTSAGFASKPTSGFCDLEGVAGLTPIFGFYESQDTSTTATNAQVILMVLTGTVPSGNKRFNVGFFGQGYAMQ